VASEQANYHAVVATGVLPCVPCGACVDAMVRRGVRMFRLISLLVVF